MDCFTNWPEVKEEEIDYEDVKLEMYPAIESPTSNETPPPKPTRKRKKKSDLRCSLDRSVKRGELNILEAGMAIQTAYENNEDGVSQDISSFLAQNVINIPIPQMPSSNQMNSNPQSFFAMMHGYGLAAQMALAAASDTSKTFRNAAPPKDIFNVVTDDPCSIKSEFNYPSTAPFSGKPIRTDLIPLMESSFSAHVRLQNYLFYLLGQSCTNQSDIQRFWSISGEKNHRYGNPSLFPNELFDSLKQIFLEFFSLDYEELDHPVYSENFSELPFLSHFAIHESKKQMFEDMAAAKKVFKSSIFLSEFKTALKELRHGTFMRYDGTSEGYFTKRQRNIPKRLMNGEDEKIPEDFEIKKEQ